MDFWLIILWTLISLVFGYFRIKFTYWEHMGVKQVKAHFLWGCISKLNTMHHTELMQEAYDVFKRKAKLAGTYIFTKPVAVILDLDLVKSILIRDFNKFSNRMEYKNDKDILSQHLFNLEGPRWRPIRNKLSPGFTAGKMKFMFPSILNVSQELIHTYDRYIDESMNGEINVYDLNARYTIDIIGSTIFGIKCNSLKDPSSSEFRQISLKMFGIKYFNIRWRIFGQTYPHVMKLLGFKRYSQKIEDVFRRLVQEGVMEREKRGIFRNDFVDILLELKKSENLSMTYDQIAAQLFVFFVAGYETSSTSMSQVLFELGRHSEIQDKLRREILEILEKYDNQLTYEGMMEMKYLDQVITETLRMYPPLRFLQRVAVEEYKVPDSDIILDKGTHILIPVRAIHYDTEIYENPKEFQPERFTPSELAKRHPQAFLGFGDGPRNCIGLRFGRMQTKIGIITLLSKYRFSHSTKTENEIEFSQHSFIMVPKHGIWMKVEKLHSN